MTCPSCGRVSDAAARFCPGCGSTLLSAPTSAPAMPARNPAMSATTAETVSFASPMPMAGAGAAVAAPGGYAAPPQVVTNISMTQAGPSVVVVQAPSGGPNLLIRALWFLFIGLWVGAFCTSLAWLLNVTIIGLPLGLYIINRLPQIMTLKPTPSNLQVVAQNGVVVISQGGPTQQPFLLRAVYFLLIGWWLSGLWLAFAWALIGVTFGLGLPLAFVMFNAVPAVTTLRRS